MGSEEKIDNCLNPIDAEAGGLVWVRRRNGSWWPGRIMSLDEFPEMSGVSLRMGTPVKLLGREDGNVDWYNLERSKRVKSFRCGEYDDCIEKAKASANNLNKKAVKYARKEDAILHALQIENAQNGKGNEEYYSKFTRSDDMKINAVVKELESVSCPSKMEESMSGEVSSFKGNTRKRMKSPNHSEEDGSEGHKRMKGLEDLGIASSSKKKDIKMLLHKPLQIDKSLLIESSLSNCLPNGGSRHSSGDSYSSSKSISSQGHKRMKGLEDLGVSSPSKKEDIKLLSHEPLKIDKSLLIESNLGNSLLHGGFRRSSGDSYISPKSISSQGHERLKGLDDLGIGSSSKKEDVKLLSHEPLKINKSLLFESNLGDSLPHGGVRHSSGDSYSSPKSISSEGHKRMKGLDDLGIASPSNKEDTKLLSHEPIKIDKSLLMESNLGINLPHGGFRRSTGDSYLSSKSISSQGAEAQEKTHRHGQLRQVLDSSAMVSVPPVCNENSSPNLPLIQGVLESTESRKKNLSAVLSNNSGTTTETSYEINDSTNSSEDTCDDELDVSDVYLELKNGKLSRKPELGDNCHPSGLFDVPLVEEDKQNGGSHVLSYSAHQRSELGMVKRQSSPCSRSGSISLSNEQPDEPGGSPSFGVPASDEFEVTDRSFSKWQLKGKRNSRILGKQNAKSPDTWRPALESKDLFWSENRVNLKKPVIEEQVFGSHNWRDSSSILQSPGPEPNYLYSAPHRRPPHLRNYSNFQYPELLNRNNYRGGTLVDVHLEVKESYRGVKRLPLVSIMSKMDGKAIVGHPLPVEVFKDDYCDSSTIVNSSPEKHEDQKSLVKPLYVPSLSPRKTPKLLKKTRKLSTLGASYEQIGGRQVLRTDKPVVSCVPLKVVLSRINEAVNSLTRPADRFCPK